MKLIKNLINWTLNLKPSKNKLKLNLKKKKTKFNRKHKEKIFLMKN